MLVDEDGGVSGVRHGVKVGLDVSEAWKAFAVGEWSLRRSGMETSIDVQSILGLVCCNQGRPRTIRADG